MIEKADKKVSSSATSQFRNTLLQWKRRLDRSCGGHGALAHHLSVPEHDVVLPRGPIRR